MPTLDEVKAQLAAYPHFKVFWPRRFWIYKEIRALPEILDHNEHIKALVDGSFNGNAWIAVCTDRRLIFLHRGTWWGTEQAQMPLDRIQSIDHESMIFFGSIRIFDGINVFTLQNVLKSCILPFVKATEEMMYSQRHPTARVATAAAGHPAAHAATAHPATGQPGAAHPPAPAPASDVATQLTKLAQLKEKGYLTDAEFQAQKKKLLES
jgi:hypothetical protein